MNEGLKRLIKVVLFFPACVVSMIQLPIAAIQWIVTSKFPAPFLNYLWDW